ncbi:MAG TPA: endonuclease/exonuclease/phosphatase family protein [Acidimicrobiales bacterium]|nr:endonuclease/exonuclease/phosphatase family protein [Acidimicrobiales bacterium]
MTRILTWNVWGRNGAWEARQGAIAAVLRGEAPDVVCLQEAWVTADGSSVAGALAGVLGFQFVDAEHHDQPGREVYMGNAVLSRWPIRHAETLWLPRLDGGLPYRTLLSVELDAPSGPVTVHCTHLDWQYDASAARVVQVQAVMRAVGARRDSAPPGHPPVLAGDLNAVPDSDEVRMLTGRSAGPVPGLIFQDAWEVAGDSGLGITWSDDNDLCVDPAWPRRRLDYVLVAWPRPRPLGNPLSCRVVGVEPVDGVQPSDHYGVAADLV